MRPLTTKYAGECRKCGAEIPAGAQAVYEKRVGIFCPGCAPTETEEIRKYRQEGADRKADRLDGWAEKREEKADAVFAQGEKYRGDVAFNTQPGHIPERARLIARTDRACESLSKAREMRAKASSLRHVVVAGDRERAREKKREITRLWIEKGMRVDTGMYGIGTVARINRKTATIEDCGTSGTFKTAVELSWVVPLPEDRERVIAKLTKIHEERKAREGVVEMRSETGEDRKAPA
jgi:hypothetical protein